MDPKWIRSETELDAKWTCNEWARDGPGMDPEWEKPSWLVKPGVNA